MILIALIGVVIFFLYQAWQDDYAKPVVTSTAAAVASVSADDAAVPAATAGSGTVGDISFATDTFAGTISLHGGTIRHLELSQFPLQKSDLDRKLPLLDDQDGRLSLLQTGLAGSDRSLTAPNTLFTSAQSRYELATGADTLEIPLQTVEADSGITVQKTFVFHRGSYLAELKQTLVNHGTMPLKASAYLRWVHNETPAGDSARFVHAFLGYGIYQQEPGTQKYKFEKLALKDLVKKPFETAQTGGWLALLDHYFLAAIIPDANEAVSYSAAPSKSEAGAYVGRIVGPYHEVAVGAETSFSAKLYFGPKTQGTLEDVAPGLDLTEDYGFITPIAKPVFWLMKFFHGLTSNWGVAIILLTLTIKAAFYKLSEAQYRSMAKARKFGPRMQELKVRFADNREALNKAMIDLYKKEGFNPLSSCWPMLIQFPVFISLYWVLIQSVELRQAPFLFWLNDLTSPDHFYVLPVLYGISMFFQQRMSGQTATMDPAQQKVMNIMPIAMSGVFAFFPSGLVLYYVVNNSIGILQQLIITKRMEGEGLGRAKA